MKTTSALSIACLLASATAAAQLPAADSAFARGDYRAARAAYEAVLAGDSLNPRALYRLAILDSWDGKLERALGRFAALRAREPRDVDLMVAHARVLAWAGRGGAAVALYDSALARDPDRADALAGRAQAVAWGGELDRAERLWREALQRHPEDAETLVGLAQTLYWQGRPDLAEGYLMRARQLAPGNVAARELERSLRAVLRPEAESGVDYTEDSDGNVLVMVAGRAAGPVGSPDRRGTLAVDWKRATDPARAGASYGAMASVVVPLTARLAVRAGAGLRRLDPEVDSATTPATALLGVTLRPSRWSGVGLTYARSPLDETALLIRRGFVLDAVEAGADFWGARGALSLGAGAGFLSDGNRRLHALAAVSLRVPVVPGLSLGPFLRVLGWRSTPGRGYFAPDQYTIVELRGNWAWQRHRWTARLDGGAGGQQVSTAAWQSEWHAGATIGRGWGANNQVALAGSVTNAAATSATGAFRYAAAGVRLRLGL